MNSKIPHRRRALGAAISLSLLLPASGAALAQQESVEEIVVTGSYIRRSEGFIQASSVTQLSASDLIDEGTLNIGEVVQNLSFVNGASSAITNTIQGTDSFNTEIDLRGLGARSTLTLLDGKRLARENVNALIPTIAISRVDIVADGSAALYGNEAVAGVVNFVPYTSYDGLKMEAYAEQDSLGDYDEHSVQMLWGGDIGGLEVVLAGQFRSNSRLGWDERNTLANAGLTFSSNAPGNWYVPLRDENGDYVGPIFGEDANGNRIVDTMHVRRNRISSDGPQPGTPDPSCVPASQRTDYTPNEVANPFGMLLAGSCFFDFGDTRSYREPTDTTQIFANAVWDYSDDLTLSGQAFHTRLYELRYTSTSNPGESRITELGSVRGEIPGNPFRAVNANGDPLFGVDMDGDGIPDRNTMGTDINNDGRPDYIVSGTVDNGVPLFEDVVPRSLRPINKTHTRPSGHTADMDNTGSTLDHVSRYTFQADFTVPYLDGWEGFAAYSYNYFQRKFMSEQNYDIEAMKTGLECDVATERANCYNPFFVTDQADNNSRHVMDAIAARGYEYEENKLGLIDVVLNGELNLGSYELPGGPVGVAVGYQWRDESYTNTPSPVELAGDTWIGGTEKESVTSGSREVDAYFLELALPLMDNLEMEAAVRREEFSTGQESTDPKFGLTYAATDWLTLRATRGDAFITPTLEQLLDPVTCGLSTVTDRFSNFSGFTTACISGNPDLGNETSESVSYGFDIEYGGFNLSITYNETDFQNRIITLLGQDLADKDFQAFKDATGFEGDGRTVKPTLEQLTAWVNDPRSNKQLVRDPGDLTTLRRIDGLAPTNAETVIVEAYDIQGGYRFGTDFGDFSLSLQATYIDHFFYQSEPEDPVVDGAGLYNDVTGAAPELPEWKVNLRTNWVMGNHSVSSTVHYIDSMPFDGPTYAHMRFFGGVYRRPEGVRDGTVRAWTDMDLAYTYRGIDLLNGDGAITLGARNVFDREAQHSTEFAGIIGGLQDPLGRVVYARFVYDF